MKDAIVIGAGIAGIASAIRLAVKGYRVTVYEVNAYPGGKLSEILEDGYRFDAGPSLFTMPQYVDELFQLTGKNPGSYGFEYKRLDVLCNYFYPDGTRIKAWSQPEKFAAEIAAKTTDSAESVSKFLAKSRRIYCVTNHVFLEKSLHRLKTYLSVHTLKSVLRIAEIDSMRSMNQANESLFKDEKTIQLFNRYATYNGSNPYKAPATLNVIPHLEYHYGAYFPLDGMNSITSSLIKLAEDCGVKFLYNSPVNEIVVKSRAVEGVRVHNDFHSASIVVSNMDVWFTYKKLLPKIKAPTRTLNQERSSSALIFYWGINSEFPKLDLHNIFFSANYKAEFETIWGHKTIYSDPTVYLNISSKYKQDDAPPGCENWFVMINVPSNQGQNWDELIATAKQNILRKLSLALNTELGPLIQTESILDPRTIESRTSSYQGALYGTSSNSRFAAFLRHPNFLRGIKGLYFAGGSVHPGGGIPLALLSAKIVGDMVSSAD
ncbi:1-hydroxycarotenoid 3,4-desaturase CrtD [Paradesertivirga mongoliensis]|uniref:1-hydroxycarotenoid 3,4-desaturase CrtD n=1 Tax=Paradesertivirga mongoliensis TaxID=2100740 RepID=A0ABW4ZG94_9SPHI|nr:1-hydroxycarotenoid 3,4-desaturase CrtD [Pedobacter mongoliensis]